MNYLIANRRLLDFIVSIHGNRVDSVKVEATLNLLLLPRYANSKVCKGRNFFLRRFIPNYIELTKGFTRLLKKGYDFVWDDTANKDFEALKLALNHTPLLFPPDYS
jgi:hypothetical protein